MELPGVQAGWISLREGESGFRLAAARGLPPALQVPAAWEGDCLCRRTLLAGELDSVTNILECERLQKAAGGAQELRYHASIPLWVRNQVVGVMNLAGPDEGMIADQDLKTLDGVGNQIAVALERAELSGISFLASRRLRGYTCLPPVWPSAHNIFPQMVPLAPFRPSGVLKTNALPASGSVFSDTAACRGSLRINFSAAKAELPRGHWQPSNPPHHRRKQPPCQMALRQQ